MKEQLIKMLLGIILERLSKDQLKKWADVGLDMVEDAVKESPNKYDDITVLPVCKAIRAAFDIEDNDS